MSPPRPFVLGEWRVEPSLNRVIRGSSSRRITPKAMEVLVLLADRSGATVSREELLDEVWGEVHVNEEVLTRAVADLRKVLEDDSRAPRYIATIPKRGYRLVVPVSSADGVQESTRKGRRSLRWAGLAALLAILGAATWSFRDTPQKRFHPLDTRPLTSLPGREVLPALSPDGNRVAFSWSGANGENWDVYVKDLDSETALRLTEDPGVDASATWSADGSRIAFERYSDHKPCRILEVDALGGEEREIGSCGESQNPDLVWSPDGKWLAFSDRDRPSESFGIYLLSPSTGKRRKLASPRGQDWGDKDPSFSPDSRWVCFTRSVSMNTQDVFRIGIEGGVAERVTFDGREVRGHAFFPDGRSLVVSSARNGHLALWRFALDGGLPPEWLVVSGATGSVLRSPNFGPSGELVFEERTNDSDIAAAFLDGAEGAPVTLVRSTREEREPAISPDGEKLAFVSARSGFSELWVSGAAGENPVRLTNFRGPYVGSPRWSSDGTRIAFDARPEGHADVFWIEASGEKRAPHRVTFEVSNALAPSFSADSRELYFGSDRSRVWQIWRTSIDGRAPAECVTRDGGYAARVSADGHSLFFTKYDRPGLFRLELASGRETAVKGTDALRDPSLWSIEDNELVFVALSTGSMAPRLRRVDLASGDVRDVGNLDAQPGGGLSLDGARDRVLFTRTVRIESDLILANFR